MSLVVIDASALAAVAFREPQDREVIDHLKGATLVAPRLLPYELTNTAQRKILQRPDQESAITHALQRALAGIFAITLSDVEFEGVLALALKTRLTVYDASYLWLAIQMKADS